MGVVEREMFQKNLAAMVDWSLEELALGETRGYVGASQLGRPCDRALQYELLAKPPDPGCQLNARILRIFEVGKALEKLAVDWLRRAGFHLLTEDVSGEQFSFSIANSRFQGHADGILLDGPTIMGYPAVWECKTMSAKNWREVERRGLAFNNLLYHTQISLYQAYLEEKMPGVSKNPALLTAINKDTEELYFELIPFDPALAQRASDRAARIIEATQAGELLPRYGLSPTNFHCRSCQWRKSCWSMS